MHTRDQYDLEIVEEVRQRYFWDRLPFNRIHTAVDVGGHIGSWTSTLKHYNSQVQVAVVEPDVDNISVAQLNLAEWDDVTVIEAAVKYEPGEYMLGRHPFHGAAHQLFRRDERPDPWREYVPVRCVFKLEGIMKLAGIESIDLLKLDCEGAEVEIVRDMAEETLSGIRWIVGEVHLPPLHFDHRTGQRLIKAGFRVEYEVHPANPTLHHFLAVRL
ncbi:MAG: FkbM family methyltransferase [Anaerolineae bacterium]|nr:FkbM family methyltransferase [Anaerolineae bacterium]